MASSLLHILSHRAKYQPKQAAYIFLQDGELESGRLTYGELEQRAKEIASHLQFWQTEKALLLYPSGLDFITAFFGCLYAGVVAVPVYPPRRSQDLSRLLSIANDAQAEIALTTSSILDNFHQKWMEQPDLARLKLISTDTLDTLGDSSQECVPKLARSETLAFLQYTSGSTGTPKGVMVTHGNIIHNQQCIQQAFGHSDRTVGVGWLPLFHDMGLIGNVLQPIYQGFPVILMPPMAFTQKPIRWLKAIAKYRATSSGAPNFAYDLCVQKIKPDELADLDLSSWDLAFVGAEPIRAETLKQFANKFAECGFDNKAFYPCYGMAETTLLATGGENKQPPVFKKVLAQQLEQNLVVETQEASPDNRLLVGCGHPYLDTTVTIANPDLLTKCEPGQVGEIWISSGSVTSGYWNRPQATAEKFQAYLKDTGEGAFLRTGDLGFFHNQELFVTGRLKDLIIIRGRNHYPQDIEQTVERSVSSLRDNCSAAFSIEIKGEEHLVVVCELKRTELRKADIDQLVQEIQSAILLEHELEVYGIALLKTATIPKTSSGKIQRRTCKQRFLAGNLNIVGQWQQTLSKAPEEYIAPNTSTQVIITDIFSELLGIEKVGINDNFFNLGGNSLLATQLVWRLRQALGVEIPLESIFESPSVIQLDASIAQWKEINPGEKAIAPLPTISPTLENHYQPFPLTDVQQAYWLGRNQNFVLGNTATHFYTELDCSMLDVAQLNRAWQKLIEHHSMLRAIFLESGQQQILEQVPIYEIEVLDLRSRSPEEVQQQLAIIREEMSHEILPAQQWPLFKIRATKINSEQTRLHLSFDTLIVDASSMMLLAKQWEQLYHDLETPLPKLEISFRDYVLAELSLKKTPQYKRSQEYWFKRNLPSAPELPLTVNSVSSIVKPKFKRYSSQLSDRQWQKLKQRAAKANITPSVVILSAFADILNCWSNNSSFTINVTLFNRLPLHHQINQLVGDFTSLTLLEVTHDLIETFANRTQKLQQQLWKDLDHSYISGVEVLRELHRQRGSIQSMGVVFTSTLGLSERQNTPLQSIGREVYGISQTSQVWLDHQIFESEGALIFNWDVVEQIFPSGLIEEMFTAYTNLLERLANADIAWKETQPQLIPTAQLTQQLKTNQTNAPISSQTLHGLFQQQVEARAQHPAVITTQQSLTYQELSDMANSLGHQLRQLGAVPNTLIAVVMEKGWEQIVAVLGILMSGAAYLPIDPEQPWERQEYLLAQGQVKIVLTQSKFEQCLVFPTDVKCLVIDQNELNTGASHTIDIVQTPTDLAYVIYTSGSTGKPKGVAIAHQGAVNTILDINQRFQVGFNDRVLALSALNFDLSVYDIFGILAAGGTIVIPNQESCRRNDPAHWLELIDTYQITVWNTVPALMQMLVQYLSIKTDTQVGNLRLALLSGDWLPVNLPQQIQSCWSEIQVISLGGATEASIWSIIYPIKQVDPNWRSIPYGKPMTNQHFYVLDKLMKTRPTWVMGDLYIGGAGLAVGYWQNETRTKNSFVTHPTTKERLYKTGDLGRYLPSGEIEFLGREDFQVKMNGFRIELGEIEAVLKQHPIAEQAIVNSDQNKLVAYVVPKHDYTDNHGINSLRAYQLGDFSETISNPIERTEFKLTQPGLRKTSSSQKVVELPLSKIDEAKKQDYLKRQSYRQFLNESISLKSFSEFLNCLSQTKINDFPLPKYRYPSAGNLYPVQTYIFIKPNGVKDLDPGIYYYNPSEHNLILLNAIEEIDTSIYSSNQPIFERSAFAIYLISKTDAIVPMYGQLAQQFCLLEAGHIGQLLMQNAPEQEIGLCPIGALEFSHIQEKFLLESNQLLLYSFIGGKIDLAQTKQLSLLSKSTQNSKSISREIKDYLKQKLPTYMIPKKYVFLKDFPLTSNGKIDRQALLSFDTNDVESETIYMAPRNATEEQVVQIWREVIQVEKIGINDNFFELGGDSLGAIRVITKIKEKFQIEVPLKNFFEEPTVKTTTEYLDAVGWVLKANQNQNLKKERVEI